MLNDALGFAKLGIAVFPLSTYSKIPPSNTSGVHGATLDADLIRKYWMQYPHGNIGIALGKISGLVAIDLDSNHGATEEDFKKFPRTVTVKTKNGYHLYYKYPSHGVSNHVVLVSPIAGDKSGAAFCRSDGYYVVGAGSIVRHPDGSEWEYQFYSDAGGELSFLECQVADLPDWCSDTPVAKGVAGPSVSSIGGPVGINSDIYGPNTRHDMFKRTAVAMRRRGEQPDKILAELILRNSHDCVPPKAGVEKELEAIVKWVVENITPLINNEQEYIVPLGWRDTTYYYTSNINPTIVSIARSEHKQAALYTLQPLRYWSAKYPSENGGVLWTQAVSDLIEACHDAGFFDESKIRGVGCWRDKSGKLVMHMGDRLYKDSSDLALNKSEDDFIYPLAKRRELHDKPLSQAECYKLIEACEAPKWLHAGYGRLLAGGLAVLRLCGALEWRPMFWLTGASGTGKSTILDQLIKPIAGDCPYIQGATTEAGIRQANKWDSLPVIFDEAETTDEKSSRRIKGVLELIRQASTANGGRILKGTASGRGLNFTANSSFFLSSIRINLTEEADINRFCLLELDRPDPSQWPAIKRAIAEINFEYGERLFSNMVSRWSLLQSVRDIFEEAIVANGEDRRKGQQFAIILAGYWLLGNNRVPTATEAQGLAFDLVSRQKIELEQEDDETGCLDRLCQFKVRIGDIDMPLHKVITLSQSNTDYREALFNHGLDVSDGHLYVRTVHYELTRVYKDSKWTGLWGNSLRRLPGASKHVHRFAGRQQRCVKIPLSQLQG
jgi:hypothetical protein